MEDYLLIGLSDLTLSLREFTRDYIDLELIFHYFYETIEVNALRESFKSMEVWVKWLEVPLKMDTL